MTFLLWLLGAGATSALSIACILAGSSGKLSWLALVPFVWTVALLAGAAQNFPDLQLARLAQPRRWARRGNIRAQ